MRAGHDAHKDGPMAWAELETGPGESEPALLGQSLQVSPEGTVWWWPVVARLDYGRPAIGTTVGNYTAQRERKK